MQPGDIWTQASTQDKEIKKFKSYLWQLIFSLIMHIAQVQFEESAECAAGAGRLCVTKDVKENDPWPEGGEVNI